MIAIFEDEFIRMFRNFDPVEKYVISRTTGMLDDKFAFTGDSLILNHKIITSFRSGSKEDFYEMTLPKLRALPPDIMIMPGHGRTFKKKEFNFDIYHQYCVKLIFNRL